MFIATLFAIAKTQKQLKFPLTDEQIKIVAYLYTLEYSSPFKKKNELLLFAQSRWTLKALAKCNKSEREKQILYDLTYIQNLKKK